MAKSFPSFAEPGMIKWCIRTARLSPAEVAIAMNREETEVAEWQEGSKSPTYSQLVRLAKICKRPISVFYLPSPPRDFTVKKFRKFRTAAGRDYSPELAYLLRTCRDRQEWLLAHLQQQGREPLAFVSSASLDDSPTDIGVEIRRLLNVSIAEQVATKNDDDAFRLWRERIESLGVCVFLGSRSGVSTSEMRGFALPDKYAPIIVVNGRERSYAARTFSLIHELAHIVTGSEGITVGDVLIQENDAKEEIVCNAIAAEVLVPVADLRKRIAFYGDDIDSAVRYMATRYRVSEQVIARRLFDNGLISREFFNGKLAEFALRKTEDLDESGDKPIPIPVQVANNVGKRFSREALSAFYAGELSGTDLSGFLNMRLQHLEGLESKISKVGA